MSMGVSQTLRGTEIYPPQYSGGLLKITNTSKGQARLVVEIKSMTDIGAPPLMK